MAGTFAASAGNMVSSPSQAFWRSPTPFDGLTDFKTEKDFDADNPRLFNADGKRKPFVALFMTPQRLYSECALTFEAVEAWTHSGDFIPLMVMPRASDVNEMGRNVYQDKFLNLTSAMRSSADFIILVGDLDTVQNAAHQANACFKTRNGKVVDHNTNLLLLNGLGKYVTQYSPYNLSAPLPEEVIPDYC